MDLFCNYITSKFIDEAGSFITLSKRLSAGLFLYGIPNFISSNLTTIARIELTVVNTKCDPFFIFHDSKLQNLQSKKIVIIYKYDMKNVNDQMEVGVAKINTKCV